MNQDQRIRQVGISECGGWSYERCGHVNRRFVQDNKKRFAATKENGLNNQLAMLTR